MVWLKFWGEHPDYAPDYGPLSPREDVYENVRYFVDGSRMRLWLDRGRKLADVKFEIKTVEETGTSTCTSSCSPSRCAA